MFIKNIIVKEVRHLKNFEIVLNADNRKHLIITGKNGSGKTSLLEKMVDWLNIFESNNFTDFHSVNGNIKYYSQQIETQNKQLMQAQTEEEKIRLNAQIKSYEMGILDLRSFQKQFNGGVDLEVESISKMKEYFDNGKFIIAYYCADRLINLQAVQNITAVQLPKKYGIKEQAFSLFLQYIVNLKAKMSMARDNGDIADVAEADKIQKWLENLERMLQRIFDDSSLELIFDYKKLDFTIHQKDRNPFNFTQLSSGYSALLNIVSDIIMRMEEKNNNGFDIGGIVMIDEIDTHLHIALQKKALDILTGFFPNIQFIVTTHSPFIINSLEDAVIFDLENKERYENLTQLSYEGVIECYFDNDMYPDKALAKFERFRILALKNDLTNDENKEFERLRQDFIITPEVFGKEISIAAKTLLLERKAT